MNKSVRKILVSLLVVAGVVAIGLGTVMLLSNKGKSTSELMTESLTKFDSFQIKQSKLMNLFSKDELNLQWTTNNTLTITAYGDKMPIKIDGTLSTFQKAIYSNWNMSIDNMMNQGVEIIQKDSKTYYKIKDVFSKYYYRENAVLDTETTNEITDMLDELQNILTKLPSMSDAIEKVISKKEIKSETATINLDGQNHNVKKLTVNLTAQDVSQILTNYLYTLQKDKELKDSLNKLLESSGTTLDEVIKGLEESLKEEENGDVLKYIIYVEENDILSREFVMTTGGIEYTLKINTYQNQDKKEVFDCSISASGNDGTVSIDATVFSMRLEEVNENKTNFTIKTLDSYDTDGLSSKNLEITGSLDTTNDSEKIVTVQSRH